MLLPIRKWKDIEGYEGLYQVSNLGEIRSLNYNHTKQTKNMSIKCEKNGYMSIGLRKKGVKKFYKIHRLVAQAFLPNPNNLPQVNHKDEDKTNNCIWNLEWCTAEYNMNYGTRNNKISHTHRTSGNHKGFEIGHKHYKSKKIRCIELDMIFDSICNANDYLGKSHRSMNISRCLKRGKGHTAFGYHWEYVD